ncbi:uncharacterized protein LOC114364761 [Ostrinia furnacalis]|uniref:uncharacterized protein LOC114364761 n=1 Tax=Ostrinia furnacalis TaxID=93504 RepID=UPI00103AD5A2|nr:uncharacterized protein LOC114364761 [Ostrinia furnacalis]
MSFAVKPKSPVSDDSISNNTRSTQMKLNKCDESEPGTSYEVFRNNTTAVEVIVKEVLNKNNKKKTGSNSSLHTIRRLQEDIENLKRELARTNSVLMRTKKGFRIIIIEMKKQLDTVNRQELERHKENLALQLENEKLKTLLESKTNMVTKFKREFSTMKRVIKLVMKHISIAPKLNENLILSSDPEFDEFANDLKRDIHVKFAKNLDSIGATFDSSTLSKDTKDSFDKHF